MYIKLDSCKIFIDILITIFNYICKQKKYSFVFKRMFLLRIIIKSKEMLICKNYFKRRFRFYAMLPLDLLRCIEYVRSNHSKYNIISPTAV